MKIPEVLLVEIDRTPGSLAKVLHAVGNVGVTVDSLEVIARSQDKSTWELTVEISDDLRTDFRELIDNLSNAHLIGKSDRVFNRHVGGKIKTVSKIDPSSLQILHDIYTPGVARVCLAIRDNPEKVKEYTNINNTVAIVTNGTAILGLGDIGPVAGLPVIEGKAALFSSLVDLSGIPILIESKDPKIIIDTVVAISPSFGAIQLEDISSPSCFEIEQEIQRKINKPVLHDDQHGTAVVVLAALLSATRITGIDLKNVTVGQIGLGAAGIGISRLLLQYGVKKLIGTTRSDEALKRLESLGGHRSTLHDLMKTADIVVATTGVKGLIKPEMVRKGQLIFALTNPDPEIEPDHALQQGAVFAADGKSVNNVSAFPGLFRGILDAGVSRFTDEILFAAAESLSSNAPEGQLIPGPLDLDAHAAVAKAVKDEALKLV